MRNILPLAFVCALAPGLSCNNGYGLLLAKQVQSRNELVGGPVAMADVGDFLLQNDQIRVNILGPKDSPGPGVFGGSIVDVDLRRDRLGFEGGQGHDRFAELFPVANLLVPNPTPDPALAQVKVLKDGSDGQEASIRVEGQGAPLFEALGILHNKADLLRLLFPDVKTSFGFRTDYIVRPGERHVLIRTTLWILDAPTQDGCAVTPESCGKTDCEFGLEGDGQGCLTCNCAQPITLDQYRGPRSVFDQIFGDNKNLPNPVYRGGVVAGDFVFFGNQNGVFAPGAGYDLDKTLHDDFYAGRNTFQKPLSFDFVTASGGDVSYGYFTKSDDPTKPVAVNMPIFTSAASAFLAAGKSCLFDASDDAECDAKRSFTFERYFAVGEGDIASVSAEVWKTRGTPTGTIRGVVASEETGEPSAKAHVYVFRDPQPGRSYPSLDVLVDACQAAFGDYGVVDVADADVGIPLVFDGSYRADLPAGDYVTVARSADGMITGVPQSVHVDAGKTAVVNAVLLTPATVQYRISDEFGALSPAKIVLVSLDAQGKPLEGDGLRRVFLGEGRLGNGVRAADYTTSGEGSIKVEPGRYRFRASRGPEFGIFEKDIQVESAGVQLVDAVVAHEVDTTGWMSADMHLHATESFDSGMAIDKRLATVIAEGVELAVSTDHDFITDYGPTRRANLLEPYVQTAVGVETTTIELGHFIAFPLKYDNTIVPTHGSHDPTCESGGDIVAALQSQGSDPKDPPFTILAHPRDGFFGYMYQLGVDPYTMERKVGSLESDNPVLQTATCDFDGMELINGKRFDLVRTPTIGEVYAWNRCHTDLEAITDRAAFTDPTAPAWSGCTLPEKLPGCVGSEPLATCKARNRSALAWAFMKQMLTRTPAEQESIWGFSTSTTCKTLGQACTQDIDCCGFACDTTKGQCSADVSYWPSLDAQHLCDLAQYDKAGTVPAAVAALPCTYYAGHVDDYFRYLEYGMKKTHIASSDSHEGIHEPGYPRTFFQSNTDRTDVVTVGDAVTSLRAGHALTTYGPFIRGSVGGKTFGDVAPAVKGGQVALDLSVQTASWFGVDRIEIYVNGHLVKELSPQKAPQEIIDYEGTLKLDVPNRDGDSWIVVVAMGLQDQNLMRPVSLDIPYGEIQLSKVSADAFALIPVVNTFFSAAPSLPDWFPIPAYAVSNPIYLDTDGNGTYDSPIKDANNQPVTRPPFCSVPCDPNAPNMCTAAEQSCVADTKDPTKGLCGYGVALKDKCTHRFPWAGNDH